MQGKDAIIPEPYLSSLSLQFKKLKMYGMITSEAIYSGDIWKVVLASQGITYFEDKNKAKKKEKEMQKASVKIRSIVATGSNLILGDVVDSALSIDNFTQRIESEIEEKGGEDSKNLKELLNEVKEFIEKMQETRCIQKKRRAF